MPTKYEYVKSWRAKQPNLRELRREEAKKYREKYPEKIRLQQDKWIANNKEKVREQGKLAARKRRISNPNAQKARNQRYREKRTALQLETAGRPKPPTCELCGEVSKVVWDHDHSSGIFRGWLCDRCNRVLGSIKDDVGLLFRMIEYLEKTKKWQS